MENPMKMDDFGVPIFSETSSRSNWGERYAPKKKMVGFFLISGKQTP